MLLLLQNFVLNLNQRKRPIMKNQFVQGRQLLIILCLSIGISISAQRELISIYNTEIYSGEDIYSAGIYNSWNGSYQIKLPKADKVERIIVEAAYELETEKLPSHKVRFSTNNDDVFVRLPKKEYHAFSKKNFYVYRANLNSQVDFAKISSDYGTAPIYFKVIVYRTKEDSDVVGTF